MSAVIANVSAGIDMMLMREKNSPTLSQQSQISLASSGVMHQNRESMDVLKKILAAIALSIGAISMIGGGSCVMLTAEQAMKNSGFPRTMALIGLGVAVVGFAFFRWGGSLWDSSDREPH